MARYLPLPAAWARAPRNPRAGGKAPAVLGVVPGVARWLRFSRVTARAAVAAAAAVVVVVVVAAAAGELAPWLAVAAATPGAATTSTGSSGRSSGRGGGGGGDRDRRHASFPPPLPVARDCAVNRETHDFWHHELNKDKWASSFQSRAKWKRLASDVDQFVRAKVLPGVPGMPGWQPRAPGDPPAAPELYAGRGVVYLAHDKLYSLTFASIRALRARGCALRVDVFHRGDELDPRRAAALAALPGVYVRDMLDPDNPRQAIRAHTYPSSANGSEPYASGRKNFYLKLHALLLCRFAEVIFIDSDNFALHDVSRLFDTEQFREYGAIFWPDYWRTHPDNPIFPILSMPCDDEWEFESAQLVLNYATHFRALLLASYFTTHPDIAPLLNGDKDTYRLAMKYLNLPYYLVPYFPGAIGNDIVHAKEATNVGTFVDHPVRLCAHTILQRFPLGAVSAQSKDTASSQELEIQAMFIHSNMIKEFPPFKHPASSLTVQEISRRANDSRDPRKCKWSHMAVYKSKGTPRAPGGLSQRHWSRLKPVFWQVNVRPKVNNPCMDLTMIRDKSSGKDNDTVLVEKLDFQVVFPGWEIEFWSNLKDSLLSLSAPHSDGRSSRGVGAERNKI